MYKVASFILSLFLWHLTGQAQILPIREARTLPLGTEVTVSGIVTSGTELGIIRYMQDSTAGIAVYPGTGSVLGFAPARGDSITVSGILKSFQNLLELDPVTHFVVHSSGHNLPDFITTSPAQITGELESSLVRINGVSFISSGNFAGSTNYNYVVNGESGTARISSSSPLVGTPIPDKMVNIMGVMSIYQTTYQLLPRDEYDIESIDFSTGPFISVLYNDKTISGGTVIYRFNAMSTTLQIKNLGELHPLVIQDISFSGPNASDYSIAGFEQEVPPLSSEDLIVNLSAVNEGTYICTLSLSHNGQGTNPFQVVLYSIKGSYASEPQAQPVNLNFSGVTTYGFTLSFEEANPPAENFIVLRSQGEAVQGVPLDGTTYMTGDIIGNAQVAYKGKASAPYRAYNIQAEKEYFFSIFAFNGPAGYENYLADNPLSGNIATPQSSPGSYYSGITSSSNNLIPLLHNKINNRQVVSYYDYRNTMVPWFVSRDTTEGRKVITCVYTGHQSVYTNFQWWSIGDLSREHTYAHSWMPTRPADGNYWYGIPEKPEYNDQHNLFPAHHLNANARRSNHPLGKVQNVTYQYLDGKLGTDNTGKTVYEPRDSHKGDAARALFYMATAYKDDFGNYFGLPANQDQELLKEWHLNDPPDNREKSRNDYIASIQANRNPFIDSMQFACFVNFHTMQYIPAPGGVCSGIVSARLANPPKENLHVYPNPFSDIVFIEVAEYLPGPYLLQIADLTGKIVYQKQVMNPDGKIQLSLSELPNGVYMLTMISQQEKFSTKLVK